jgi:hypothetical protein
MNAMRLLFGAQVRQGLLECLFGRGTAYTIAQHRMFVAWAPLYAS